MHRRCGVTLDALMRELHARGYPATNAKGEGATLLITFDLMPGRCPAWLKAVEVHSTARFPADLVGLELGRWQMSVLAAIAEGRPSSIVRRMIAEHGHEAVIAAMRPHFALGAAA